MSNKNGDLPPLNPEGTLVARQIIQQLVDSGQLFLVHPDAKPGAMGSDVPVLAAEWHISEDGERHLLELGIKITPEDGREAKVDKESLLKALGGDTRDLFHYLQHARAWTPEGRKWLPEAGPKRQQFAIERLQAMAKAGQIYFLNEGEAPTLRAVSGVAPSLNKLGIHTVKMTGYDALVVGSDIEAVTGGAAGKKAALASIETYAVNPHATSARSME